MIDAAYIAKALDPNFRSSGDGGYVCKCPTHDDKNPSLKVSDGKNGKPVVYCHAGCDQKVVIAELAGRNLWPQAERRERASRRMARPPAPANDDAPVAEEARTPKVKERVVATYDYFDHETGELLMQVVRYEPKNFKQRRPDDNAPSGWIYNVGPEHRTLYNAIRAFKHDKAVLVVEGEKDVDNLKAINVVAVCNPGGAGKWQDNYSEILRDKDVILVPDNDPQAVNKRTGELQWHPDGRPKHAGQDHMDMVGEKLQGIARSVKILHLPGLPEKGDISDWLQIEENDRKALAKLCAEAPLWAPTQPPAKQEQEPELPSRPLDVGPSAHAPFQCLGYNKGTFYYLSSETQQVIELTAAGHTKAALLGLADLMFWMHEFPNNRGKFDVEMAANWMMRTCARKGVWSPTDTRGRGAWWDEGRIVVHCGDLLYVDRTPMAPSAISSQYVYEMGRPMRAAIDDPLSADEARLYLDHMQRMPFSRDLDAVMMAGWTVCAHVGGVLNWRPHIWLVGAKGTGKSYVMDKVVKPLFGADRCLAVASSTTEAGLRQSLGSDAIPVLFEVASVNVV